MRTKQEYENTMIDVPFSIADILILHAVLTLSDGRIGLTKLLKRRVTPVAMKLIEELEKEEDQERKVNKNEQK